MLRGVNRQIIEINSTDNGYFERAILFVRPEFSDASKTQLENNANSFLEDIAKGKLCSTTIKKAAKNSRQKVYLSLGATALGVAIIAVILLKVLA